MTEAASTPETTPAGTTETTPAGAPAGPDPDLGLLGMVEHRLRRHPTTARDSLASTSNTGSASCSCESWSIDTLPNAAGDTAIRREFTEHVLAETTTALAHLTEALTDLLAGWESPEVPGEDFTPPRAAAELREACDL